MKTALLDLNILIALLWPAHEHHAPAHRWFAGRSNARWATCPLTQLGFVRLMSNPAFSRDALSARDALSLLAVNIAHARHEFWADELPVTDAVGPLASRLTGHRQVTDAYLAGLAHRRKGSLATFDRGLRTLAGPELVDAIEIVPTR